MIKGVVFDLDDTLYLEADYAKSGMTFIGHWVKEKWGILGFGEELNRLWDAKIRTKTFDIALANVGAELNQTQIMEMVEQYRRHLPKIDLQDDAHWILNKLKNTFTLGLITDGFEAAQNKKIEALKIHKWMSQIIVTDSLGRDCWKPSPVPYQLMEKKLNLSGEECLYVGDNIKKDFVAARKRGWKTIQIARPDRIHQDPDVIDPSYRADMKIDTLLSLPSLLNA